MDKHSITQLSENNIRLFASITTPFKNFKYDFLVKSNNLSIILNHHENDMGRSQLPRGLRRRSTAACLLRSWVHSIRWLLFQFPVPSRFPTFSSRCLRLRHLLPVTSISHIPIKLILYLDFLLASYE
jgi:hypothetical protein